MNKNYLDITGLTDILQKLKAKFAGLVHTHTKKDITDYMVDTELSSTSTNPVENKTIKAEFDLVDNKIQTDIDSLRNEFKTYVDEMSPGVDDGHTPDVSGQINTHNTATDAHNDIRVLINDLRTVLTNFLDVDDETKDQLSEVITLIENNRGTLESLTTSKVNVGDIIDNLTTNSSSKVLSAAQGVAIKALIDALEKELDEHSHEISDIVNLQSNLNDKASKNDLGIITGTTSLGDFGTKTVADLQSSLDTWLGSVYDKVNASATFKASDDWITGWNSGNVTSIISNGGYWTVTIVTKYNNSNYMQLKVSNYSDRSVYYVCKYNSQWHNALKVVFDDELAIHKGNSTVHITAEERTNWNDAVANSAYINATDSESEEDPTPVSISVIDPAGAEESDIGMAADAYKTKVAIDNINEKVGSTDISGIGDGTVTGAIAALDSMLATKMQIMHFTETVGTGNSVGGISIPRSKYPGALAIIPLGYDVSSLYRVALSSISDTYFGILVQSARDNAWADGVTVSFYTLVLY